MEVVKERQYHIVCVCVCVCVYIYIYICICVYIYIYIYSMHTYTYLLTCIISYSLTYLLAYLLTYILTPWNRVLLETLTGFHLVKKFPAFYRTRRFITAFTSACHLSLS